MNFKMIENKFELYFTYRKQRRM